MRQRNRKDGAARAVHFPQLREHKPDSKEGCAPLRIEVQSKASTIPAKRTYVDAVAATVRGAPRVCLGVPAALKGKMRTYEHKSRPTERRVRHPPPKCALRPE